jgi:hypothetical protein
MTEAFFIARFPTVSNRYDAIELRKISLIFTVTPAKAGVQIS